MISKIDIAVRYAETDQMGVVYHANYLVWFDMARTKFFTDAGFDHAKIEEDGIMFPVHNIDITYKSPCKYGDVVTVSTTLVKFNKYTSVYSHEIKDSNGVLKSKGFSTLAHCDKKTFKLIPLDTHLPSVFKKYSDFVVAKNK